ncbi:hypothetical protein CUMW_260060 [Citrus unshiu]|nr:hypothetical protein CUMW_260060 [Citrus unshiu]
MLVLFKRLAFFGRSTEKCEKLEQIGQRIARKCKGLPLAVKTVRSLMSSKKTEEEWKRILNSDLWKVEEIEKGVLTPLWLSYNDLPSRVKRCFSYCAVFLKDYNIKKDQLITLWMAQGYLSAQQDEEMETIGEEYFGILASRSFFQEFEKSYDNRIIECKMHDMVHDFAQFVSENECFSLEINGGEELNVTNSLDKKVRHLMLVIEAIFPISTCRVKRIRSLLIDGSRSDHSSLNGGILEELFRELTSLRALDFCESFIPRNIEKLVHLRYLNLSGQDIVQLSETLCELYILEKLDISYCMDLEELPEGIKKLINMRHLLNDGTDTLRYMVVGIGRLTGLRTLGEFHVSGGGGVDGRKACRLESLKNLEHLQVCGIRRLGYVSDVSEAKRLELDKKKYLSYLRLEFDKKEEEGETRKNEDDQLLLEALPPPLDLKKLEIRYYRGNTVFPNWMMSLTNLRSLLVQKLRAAASFGKMPSLEKLHIWGMKRVKKVVIIAFPKLKSLLIEDLLELEEWDYGITRTGNTVIDIMPRLSSFEIKWCPKLKALPDYIHQTTTLKELRILMCGLLKERSRAGYEMRSLLVKGLPITEPKENETISRQQLAVGSEWRPLTKFSSSCNAITIILSLRLVKRVSEATANIHGWDTNLMGNPNCLFWQMKLNFQQNKAVATGLRLMSKEVCFLNGVTNVFQLNLSYDARSRAGYEMRSSLVEVLPVTEPKENETISRQQLAVASEWRPLTKFSSRCNAITITLSLRVRMVLDWGIKKKEAEQDCGNEKVFSESLNSGLDGSPSYCQESPHVRSCGSFHQPEPEPVAMDNSVIHVIRLRIFSSLFRQLSEFSLLARNLYGDKDTGKYSEIEAVGSKFIWSVDNDEQKGLNLSEFVRFSI